MMNTGALRHADDYEVMRQGVVRATEAAVTRIIPTTAMTVSPLALTSGCAFSISLATIVAVGETHILSRDVVTATKISLMLNGTINGRIDFELDSGTATFSNLSNIFLLDATLANGGGIGSDQWTTSTFSVVSSPTGVPEPASVFLLLASGLISVGIWQYRRLVTAALRTNRFGVSHLRKVQR
jgi:hypothetical protein